MQPIGQGSSDVTPVAVAKPGIGELGITVVDLDAGDSIGIGIGASEEQGGVLG